MSHSNSDQSGAEQSRIEQSRAEQGTAEAAPVLELTGIHHRYGHVVALRKCSLVVRPGEIHGLVGENGSGKSTMVKILSGIVQPTRGDVAVSGRPIRLKSPAQAQESGIITVFQETLIAEGNSATENVFIGTDGTFRHRRRRREELQKAGETLEQLGVDPVILRRPVHALSLAHRQVLTLVRALVRPWKLLVLDEATSALDIGTRDRLFEHIRGLRAEGRSVLFVSHRMDELSLLVDRVTVQRSGSTVGVLDKQAATPERLVSLMSGRGEESAGQGPEGALPQRGEGATKEERVDAAVLLGFRGTRLAGGDPFDLDVRAGEILGVAGLEGQGGSDLVEAMAGVQRAVAGDMTVDGRTVSRGFRTYREAFRAGVAYVPAKRQEEGLFGPLSVRDNMAISTIDRLGRFGFHRKRTVSARVQHYMDLLAVSPDDQDKQISALSGGNAQKVLISRWLAAGPQVLILNDPLRGVDIGTKRQFYGLLQELADDGVAVVLLSTEIEELLVTSHRIAVCRGASVSTVLAPEAQSYDAVLAAMFGISHREAEEMTGGLAS